MNTPEPEEAPLSPSAESDRELVAACLRGDERAWEALVEEYTPWVRGVIRHVLAKWAVPHQLDDVDDLCSTVFTELLSRDRATLRSFSAPYNLKSWLAVIARRMCVRSRRGRIPSVPLNEAAASLEEPAASDPPAEESSSTLEGLLEGLEAEDRAIIELFYVQERSHEEISAILDIPTNTLRKKKSRILDMLRTSPQFKRLRELLQ